MATLRQLLSTATRRHHCPRTATLRRLLLTGMRHRPLPTATLPRSSFCRDSLPMCAATTPVGGTRATDRALSRAQWLVIDRARRGGGAVFVKEKFGLENDVENGTSNGLVLLHQ